MLLACTRLFLYVVRRRLLVRLRLVRLLFCLRLDLLSVVCWKRGKLNSTFVVDRPVPRRNRHVTIGEVGESLRPTNY